MLNAISQTERGTLFSQLYVYSERVELTEAQQNGDHGASGRQMKRCDGQRVQSIRQLLETHYAAQRWQVIELYCVPEISGEGRSCVTYSYHSHKNTNVDKGCERKLWEVVGTFAALTAVMAL